ncbi:DNA primase [Mucinivorans hirudinis]|uniref:DNA primase n=1 Tax=Mucinivorans hirudinis TaxID=1433126 RepID=A0A060R7H1_9BACT|nr:DNA primase [Mucinivorans hirudinis]
MNIEQAKSIQLTDYMHSIGCTLIKQQGVSLWYLSPLRAESEPSFKINLNRNEWYDFGAGVGGDIIRLVMELHRTTDVGEVLRILGNKPISHDSLSFRPQESFQCFEDISVKPLENVALLQFLAERKIPADIAAAYCKEVHYKLGSKPYFAIGFENVSGGYELRNKYFKGCISPKAISHIGNTNRSCCLFEGFMDMLSFQTLCRQKGVDLVKYDIVVLNSVGNVSASISPLRNYEQVHCYLDNDSAGQRATAEIGRQLGSKLIDRSLSYALHKDLNDYLCGKPIASEKHIIKPRKMKL